MKPTPDGWPRISSSLFYDDAAAAIDWLCRVFGFEVRLKVEGGDGEIVHSELVLADGLIMVGQTGRRPFCRSPASIDGGNTQSLLVFVDDVDALSARIRKEGGTITDEPTTTDYGEEYWSDRTLGAVDCEGHHWWFSQRLSTGAQGWSQVRNKIDTHE
jgi:uncharacterized glyoxalase superfamily protein PhnB